MEWQYANMSDSGSINHFSWGNDTFLMAATASLTENQTTPQVQSYSIEDDMFGYAMKQVNIYLTPVIVFVGIITNLISFCVFVMTHLRLQSSSIYLATLALSDSGFLFALFLSWFSWIKIHLVHRTFWCQIIIYLTYACSFISIYSVVGFTCERFVAVLYPLQRKRLCTRKNALIVEIVNTVVALLLYSFTLWTTTIIKGPARDSICVPRRKFLSFINIMNNFDTVITLIIPSIVIIILNIRIGFTVYEVVLRRNKLRESQRQITRGPSLNGQDDSSSGQSPNKPHNQKSGDDSVSIITTHRHHSAASVRKRMTSSSQIRTTRMLLLVSTVFVLLNLPSHAFRIHGFVLQLLHKEYYISLNLSRWQELCQIIYYCNFATNFFLYSFSARSFRDALKRLVKRARNKCHKMAISVNSCFQCNFHRSRRQSNPIVFSKFTIQDKKSPKGLRSEKNAPCTM